MARKKIPANVVDSVLVACRRRCCICFGLNRDTEQKNGQIAHLDQDSSNASLENLAYLCLHHHDQYDGRASVSKGLTIGEVKIFRAELRSTVKRLLSESMRFGALELKSTDPYSGHYVLRGSNIGSLAEIDITPLPDEIDGTIRYFVSGFALVGGHKPQGPNIGSLGFAANLDGAMLRHMSGHRDPSGDPHIIEIILADEHLTVTETGHWGNYAMSISFAGSYDRAEPIEYAEWRWANPDARTMFGAGPDPEADLWVE